MKIFIGMLACVLLVGCVEEPEPVVTSQTVDVVDDKADRGRWKARAADTSVWFDTRIVATDTAWTVSGRTSRDLHGLSATTESGSVIGSEQLSKRRFLLTLDDDAVRRVASGERIFVRFETGRGAVYAMSRYAPRLGSFEGDDSLFILTSVNPILVGNESKVRGRVSVPSGWSLDVATSDVGWEGEVGHDPHFWMFDFPLEAVPALLDRAPLSFLATDVESQNLIKTATLRLRLAQLGVSDGEPTEVWAPTSCEDVVADCLDDEPRDTGRCGYLNEVSACLSPFAAQFARDLEFAVGEYYDAHDREIAAREGRTKSAALLKLSPYDVRVVERDDGSWGGAMSVVRHPGVIFRNSTHIWYGTYDSSGQLLDIELVNDTFD